MINPALSNEAFSVAGSDLLSKAEPHQPAIADLQLLAEVGLSAAVKGNVEISRPIFEALALWRPDHPVAVIGVALAFLSDGEFGSAIDLLKPAHQLDPSSSEVAAFLLIAFALAERWAEARAVKKTLLNGPEGPGRAIAMQLASVIDS